MKTNSCTGIAVSARDIAGDNSGIASRARWTNVVQVSRAAALAPPRRKPPRRNSRTLRQRRPAMRLRTLLLLLPGGFRLLERKHRPGSDAKDRTALHLRPGG